MEEMEFWNYHNRFCEFTFDDNSKVSGVILFEPSDHSKYILVRAYNMKEYKNASDIADTQKCKELSEEVEISTIHSAKILI